MKKTLDKCYQKSYIIYRDNERKRKEREDERNNVALKRRAASVGFFL